MILDTKYLHIHGLSDRDQNLDTIRFKSENTVTVIFDMLVNKYRLYQNDQNEKYIQKL